MATAVSTTAPPVYSSLDSATAIALAIEVATEESASNRPYVWDISDMLFMLMDKGFRFKDLGLRKIPGGYHSEDVEDFVGRLLSAGYATQHSPIRLTALGRALCDRIIRAEHDQAEVARLREELGKLWREAVSGP